MLLAVLEARAGLGFGSSEVYLNVAGGLRGVDPAADLAVAAALVSAALDVPVPADCLAFGEIALSGEVRPAAHAPIRLKEAEKLGFRKALVPDATKGVGRLQTVPVASVRALVDRIRASA
jgi:DNA repair protein RadA/Sms